MKILSLNQFNEKIIFQKRKISDIKNLGDPVIELIEFPELGKTLKDSLKENMIVEITEAVKLKHTYAIVYRNFLCSDLWYYPIKILDSTIDNIDNYHYKITKIWNCDDKNLCNSQESCSADLKTYVKNKKPIWERT